MHTGGTYLINRSSPVRAESGSPVLVGRMGSLTGNEEVGSG